MMRLWLRLQEIENAHGLRLGTLAPIRHQYFLGVSKFSAAQDSNRSADRNRELELASLCPAHSRPRSCPRGPRRCTSRCRGRAPGPCRFFAHLPEALEDRLQHVAGDPGSGVGDREGVHRRRVAADGDLPPSGVNLIALVIRLANTWSIRSWSKSARCGLLDPPSSRRDSLLGRGVRERVDRLGDQGGRVAARGPRASLPASMLTTSTRSPISRFMRAA